MKIVKNKNVHNFLQSLVHAMPLAIMAYMHELIQQYLFYTKFPPNSMTPDIYVTYAQERQLPWEQQFLHSYSFNTSHWLHK